MKSGSTMAFSRFPRWFVSAATGILTLMAGSIATAQNQTNNIQPDQFQAGQTVFSQSLSSQESTNPRAGWDGLDVASARLISAVTASGSGETIPMGLEFDLAPGWKIYWRTPGDAGLPPVPDWSKSDNVADVVMHWPVPERFEIFDIGTLGYGGEIIFPLTVTPEIPGAPIRLAGEIDFLACAEICIPGRADLAFSLPSGPASIAPEAHRIERFRAAVPVTDSTRAGLSITSSTVNEQSEGGVRLVVEVASPDQALTTPDAFIEGPGGAYFDAPGIVLSEDRHNATLTVDAPSRMTLASLTGEGVTITLVDQTRALEARITPQAGGSSITPAGPVQAIDLWTILGLALLGGLILNLMPCVLPVLSLKLMSVATKSGKDASAIRAGFLASSAGIILSFLLLAGAAIVVKQVGVSVGWGMQFQQPVFLALMVALLVLFACNLLGLFEFRLPGQLGDRAASVGEGRNGLFKDFLTGAFATLLATPCSAPFLGTAVGFALGAGSGEILAVFLALGIGLALPYLLVASIPGLIRFLPRPGRWMQILKWILAAALVGTALWLLSVMQVTLGAENTIAIAALVALAAAVLALRHREGSRLGRAAWPVSAALALAAVAAPLTMTLEAPGNLPTVTAAQAGISWQRFDEATIPDLVAAGQTVLVDVTADWCVTCQWNKKTVLEVGDVATWLAQDSVIAMRADWTRPDPAISNFLARHGRYGIPFNIIYGPDAPQGIALPELLTARAVLNAAVTADPQASVAKAH